MMYKIEAIVREEKYEEIKHALNMVGVNGITAWQVLGFRSQRGYKRYVRGQEIDVMTHTKVKFEIVVSSKDWCDKTIETIIEVARTGNVGDGKIFVSEISEAIRIRTGESGYGALQPDKEK